MAMNGLRTLVSALETGANEILIDEATRKRAVAPLQRMLDFAEGHRIELQQTANA